MDYATALKTLVQNRMRANGETERQATNGILRHFFRQPEPFYGAVYPPLGLDAMVKTAEQVLFINATRASRAAA